MGLGRPPQFEEGIPKSIRPRRWHRLYRRSGLARRLAWHFHRAYYYGMDTTMSSMTWLGTPLLKYPQDLWAYQEIIAELRPRLIVETGTHLGGSAHFFASLLELIGGDGRVITIDLNVPETPRPEHERVTYLHGSSIDPEIVKEVNSAAAGTSPVLVILDSNHSFEHVLAELRSYADLVTPGSYLIVEDSNVNGYPVLPDHGPGPMEAIFRFVGGRDDFTIDRSREKFMVTAAPRGFLRRGDGDQKG